MNGLIKRAYETIPIMGFIDITGISEDDICDVKYKLKNSIIKPSDEHSIEVQLEFDIYCSVFGNKEISMIQDMYSPSRNIGFSQTNALSMVNMKNTRNTVNIREKVKLEEADYKIADVMANVDINEIKASNDKAEYSGDLNLQFILINDEGKSAKTEEVNVPIAFSQEISGLRKDSIINVDVSPMFEEFTKDSMEVSAKVDLEVNTLAYNLENVNVIDNIEELAEGDDNPYSMIIYFVKPGDSLWKIAKKYKSTVDDIVRVNNIENPDKISVGMQLFIPKVLRCRTEAKVNA